MVKNLPTRQETQVQSLNWEDPLEKGMATYSSILAWRIPWTEEPLGLQSMGSQRVRHNLEAEQQRTVPDSVTLAHEAPLSMEFSRQEYWTVLPFPSPGDLPNPGMEPKSAVSPALLGRFFTTGPPGKPRL